MSQDTIIRDIAFALALAEHKKLDPKAVHHAVTNEDLKAQDAKARKIYKHICTVLMNQSIGNPIVPFEDVQALVNSARDPLSMHIRLPVLAEKLNGKIKTTFDRDLAKRDPKAEKIRNIYQGRTQELLLSLNDAANPIPQSPLQQIQQHDGDDSQLIKAGSTTVDIELPGTMTNTVRDLLGAILKKYPHMEVKEAYNLARKSVDVIAEILMNSELRQVDQSEITDFIDACRNQQTGNIFLGAINKKLEGIIESTQIRDAIKKDPQAQGIENRSKDRVRELALFEEPLTPLEKIQQQRAAAASAPLQR